MTLFDRLDLAAHAVQEAVFGTPGALFIPMCKSKNVNAAWVADTSRATVPLTVIYTEKDVTMNLAENTESGQDHRPGVSAHILHVEIDPRRWPVVPNIGDIVQLADLRRFRIFSTDPADVGRVICGVNYLGKATA